MAVNAASPWQVRDEFERLVVGDLHGPAFGPRETLPARPLVRDRYLVGMLAPRDVRTDPARFDEASNVDGDDEAGAETDRSAAVGFFPSSFGLSFVVDADATKIEARASWGHYRKEQRDAEELRNLEGFHIRKSDAERENLPVWQRYPREGIVQLALLSGDIEATVPVAEQPAVVVRGRVRQRDDGSRLVTLFLVNEQTSAKSNADERWLFQAALTVRAPDGRPIFLERSHSESVQSETDSERVQLTMLYRHALEFAVGHGVAVRAERAPGDDRRALSISTCNVPTYELARTDQPNVAENPLLAPLERDMAVLATTLDSQFRERLQPVVTAFRDWIDAQERRIADSTQRLTEHAEAARDAITQARAVATRIEAGIALLASDPNAAEAFRFANEAMWQQRIRQIAIAQRRRLTEAAPSDEERDAIPPLEEFIRAADVPTNRSWRLFQLAFICLNLPSLVDPRHSERSGEDAVVDLLFFPTGGGKTEAYLGLVAFTLAIRRLQGTIESEDGPLDGSEGVAVFMRYTLRLLTSQQFARASALICACEVLRREKAAADARWGATPFRLGLWIGQNTTPNYFKASLDAVEAARQRSGYTGGYANPLQLAACPWCGATLQIGRDIKPDKQRWRTLLYCSDPFGTCAFTQRRAPDEGIPVVTTDEEVYRLLPAFLIATIDKFARLPWLGPMHLLFGRTHQRCERHGFRSPDLDGSPGCEENDRHNAAGSLPPHKTVACGRLRPPDLIIQDELHLISGPLGTLAGLYETAIDYLASVRIGGTVVRPKVVASTATIRRASTQVNALFARRLSLFPPPVIDAGETFFARETPPSQATPGRLYVGICARGQRLKAAEARMSISILAAAQKIFDLYGEAADPYMTMLDYFSSLRELAGMRRLVDDDVRQRLPMAATRGLGRRPPSLIVKELTSRMSSSEIPKTLDGLNVGFTPGTRSSYNGPFDVVLATNMVSVGVDVPRLGLMMVVGQPKSTAEYIQATSRIGREESKPGIVFTLYNWARPRDLSHYERFEFDHATFYRHVEPLSLTPFSSRALDRALTAVIVGVVRHENAHLPLGLSLNPDEAAQIAPLVERSVRTVVDAIERRAAHVLPDPRVAAEVRRRADELLDIWIDRQRSAAHHQAPLSYGGGAKRKALLERPGRRRWDRWTAPNSLRETEHNVNLLLAFDDSSIDDPRPYQLTTSIAVPNAAPNVEDEDVEERIDEQ